jgi:hypothetical protein
MPSVSKKFATERDAERGPGRLERALLRMADAVRSVRYQNA